MNLPLIDIVPRMQRMISHPERMRPAIAAAVGVGLVDGAALAALLPTISTLAQGTPVWGFGLAGWLWILGILSAAAFGLNYITQYTNYAVALDSCAACIDWSAIRWPGSRSDGSPVRSPVHSRGWCPPS